MAGRALRPCELLFGLRLALGRCQHCIPRTLCEGVFIADGRRLSLFKTEHTRPKACTEDVQMALEDHPLYPEWRSALARVIATKEARDSHRIGSKEFRAANAEYQAALAAYDAVARKV